MLRTTASRILALEISDPLQLSIVETLVDGPRSTAELVEEIFGQDKDQAGYMTSYSKTRRALEKLSSKGYVSRRFFGSVKPFRLTEYGFSRLASFASGSDPPKLFPRTELVLHTATTALACFLLLSTNDTVAAPDALLVPLNSAFFFALGLSVSRIAVGLRRVL